MIVPALIYLAGFTQPNTPDKSPAMRPMAEEEARRFQHHCTSNYGPWFRAAKPMTISAPTIAIPAPMRSVDFGR